MQLHHEKAKPIQLLILDVDGVLTDGTISFGPNGHEVKDFHALDGLGIKLLQKSGVHVAIISGHHSIAAALRFSELGIEHAYLGFTDKVPVYEKIKLAMQLDDASIAYMGDDFPDLPVMRRVGFAITVPHAPQPLKQHSDYVTTAHGGKGAVREVCEYLLHAQGRFDAMVESFLNQ